MVTPRTGRPRGRPRFQETADRVVAAALATAGARVDGPAWSTRALAEHTGLAQTAVSRAVRTLAGGVPTAGPALAESVPEADSLVLRALLIGPGSRAGGPAGEGSSMVCRAEFAVVPPRRTQGGEQEFAGRPGPGHEVDGWQAAEAQLSEPQASGRQGTALPVRAEPGRASSAVQRRRRAALMGALLSAGVRCRAEFPAQLAACEDIPLDLLEELRGFVAAGRTDLTWRAQADVPRVAEADVPQAAGVDAGPAAGGSPAPALPLSDSNSAGLQRWLPRAGTSATEQLAVRLRDAIVETGLRPGDQLTAARAAALLDVPRARAADVLRRLVDDEILDGSAGYVRVPVASASDVIELYAARMLLGDVLLRAAAHRPRRYLLPTRRALDAVVSGAESGRHVDDADLRFQQEWARASGLSQTVRMFESSTVRVRMLIAVLRLDYARTATSILRDDRAILTALVGGDGPAAVRAWHRKIDSAVRHMHGRARSAAFDVQLWGRLTGM